MSRSFLYCGPQSRSPLQLLCDWAAAPPGPPDWPQFRDRNVHLTWQGRSAVALLARWLRLGPGDDVLMPAYNCGTEVDPFVKAGARVVLYRTDERARIDLADLISKAGERARIAYVIHYFGWSQDLAELTAWCRRRQITLVEDCALALFSSTAAGPLGTAGDAAIFSFPKSLPITFGGALSLDGGPLKVDLEPPPAAAALRGIMPLLKRHVLRSLNLRRPVKARAHAEPAADPHPAMPESYYWRAAAPARISALSRGTISRLDHAQISSRRRLNYQRLEPLVRELPGVRIFYDHLPEFVCPLGLPILVESRQQWVDGLQALGVEVSAWWDGYHRGLDWSEFPEARTLKREVLLLPVHDQLSADHIAYIGEATRRVAFQSRARG